MEIPVFGFGTYQLREDTAQTMTRVALEHGVRHIDTAQGYHNEEFVGAGVKESGVDRDEIFITTKIDNSMHEPDALARSIRESLVKLDTDYVDLLLIHWPVEWDRIGATLSTLNQVHGGGLARHIGVSNFTIDQLETAKEIAPLEVLQVECHPWFQQPELRTWCEDHGWAFTAYSPLGKGKAVDDPVLADIAATHGVAPTAVALKWLSTLPMVNVIPRTSSEEHLAFNLQARELELSDDELDRVAALHNGQRLINPPFGPWNE